MFSIFSFYSVPSFASGIEADSSGAALPADCDSDTLDTTSGTANLRADFEANRIDLRWYDNNTMLNVSSTSSDNCTYDTAIDLPTNPTKTGYTFKGWKVRPEYNFASLDETITGNGFSKNANGECKSDRSVWQITTCDADFADLNDNEWKVQYSYGTVYGMSWCSTTTNPGDGVATTINQSGYGINCWCRATGYKPNGSSVKYSPTKPTKWIMQRAYTVDECKEDCALHCAPTSSTAWRASLFGKS